MGGRLLISSFYPRGGISRSDLTREVGEGGVGAGTRLDLGLLQVPVVVNKAAGVLANLGSTHVRVCRVEVLVQTILHVVFSRWRRLHLRRAEPVTGFGEGTRLGTAHDRRAQTASYEIVLLVVARAGKLLLFLQLLLEVSNLLSDGVIGAWSSSAEHVLFLVTIGTWKVLILLLEDLVDVNLLHYSTRNAKRVTESTVLS
jgi:hypothetical protein